MKLKDLLLKETSNTTSKVPTGTPILKRGSRGEPVKQLQTILGLTGKSIDGIYGSETKAWVTVWQEEHGFTGKDIDGIYGPKTAAAMKKDPVPVKDQARAKRLTQELRSKFKTNTTPSATLSRDVLYKQLEAKFPDVFLGNEPAGTNSPAPKKMLNIGADTVGKTYEEAMKKNIYATMSNTSEYTLLRIFKQMNKQQLDTLFKLYKTVNNTNLAADLKVKVFNQSEMTDLLEIFREKGLNPPI